jgi:hypothetical protein
MRSGLSFKATHRDVVESDGSCVLREMAKEYALNSPLKLRL